MIVLLILMLQFYLIPSLVASPYTPDFVLIGMLLLVVRQPPGFAAVTGLLVGLAWDALNPSRFGAAMLAHTLVGLGAAWGRAMFFADNLLVAAGLFFLGTWSRDLLLALGSGTSFEHLLTVAAVQAPLHAAITAVAGVLMVVLFRDWLAIRIER